MNERLQLDVDRYCLAAGTEKITSDQYRRSVRCLSEFLGRPAMRSDLTAETVNRWLASLEIRRSPCTVRNRKRGITPIWNWLAQLGAVKFYNPRELRKIRVDRKAPSAWSIEQVQQLIAGASDLTGFLTCGLKGSHLMDAWVRVAYETGIRPGDLYRLRWEQLSGPVLQFCQHKTRGAHAAMLSEPTLCSVERLRQPRSSTIFVLGKSGMRRWELLLFKAASRHGFTRMPGQSTGTLRKTAATETARAEGLQAAADLLGHRSGTQVTRDHYVQPEALTPRQPPQGLIDALANTNDADSAGGMRAG